MGVATDHFPDEGSTGHVEFEDAQVGSIFVRRTRQVTEWSPRFLRGMAQLIDWLYLLDDQQQTLAFEEHFGPRPISVTVLLILGRDSRISDADRRRLRWWREHVVVDSHQLYCCTFDELVGRRAGRRSAMASALASLGTHDPDAGLSGPPEIVLVIDDRVEPDNHKSYPPGFFEETYGSLADDPLPLMSDQEMLPSK